MSLPDVVSGLLLRGRPQVRLLSGTFFKKAKVPPLPEKDLCFFLCLFFLDCSLTLAPFAPTWAWRSLCSGQPEAPLTSTALFCLRRSALFSFSYYFFFFSSLLDKEFPSEFFWRVANIQEKSKNFILAQIKKEEFLPLLKSPHYLHFY